MDHFARRFFPDLNTKVLQNFIRLYRKRGKRPQPKSPINPSIYIDQAFNIKKTNETKITNYWLRFHKKNFPLFGKRILNRISKFSQVKLIQIYKKNNNLYCKLCLVNPLALPKENKNSKTIGCDVNFKTLVLSDNSFFSLAKLAHRKLEHKKNNSKKKNLTNFSKDFCHKITSQMVEHLLSTGSKVLILEDLRTLRKNASRKYGSYSKLRNYIINTMPYGMIQNFLEYKCLDAGILVHKINPAYTSKTCSACESLETQRPTQNSFVCQKCGLKLHADLNGSRNIEKFYTNTRWATSESSPAKDL